MANWFECKAKYDKVQENGSVKATPESYLVDALSFTEAEARIIEELTPFVSGELTVESVKRTRIYEIFWDDSADKWYMVKYAIISIDEKSAVEKRSMVNAMVAANDFRGALDNFMEGMKGTLADFEIVSIAETKIMDVYKVILDGSKPKAPAKADDTAEAPKAE